MSKNEKISKDLSFRFNFVSLNNKIKMFKYLEQINPKLHKSVFNKKYNIINIEKDNNIQSVYINCPNCDQEIIYKISKK